MRNNDGLCLPPAVTLIVPRGWSVGSRQPTPSVRCQLIVAVSAYLRIREYIDNNMSSTPFHDALPLTLDLKNTDVAHGNNLRSGQL